MNTFSVSIAYTGIQQCSVFYGVSESDLIALLNNLKSLKVAAIAHEKGRVTYVFPQNVAQISVTPTDE